ncbi:FKBP-type 22 kDa peptidyl-prolyl cis-trans isomerase [bioreactor metagenome]|uniref:peptidylprolyl isomerase n=1 Tax=bioreactor metagenome TaxID=1076179 RepID=A0A645BDF6_9ZZZZ|nr:FKBP-type peptidyl-prolyl cis-trans isomerase [Rikenellaceae bacterium]
MKKVFKTISLAVIASLMLASCEGTKKSETLPGISQGLIDSVSYAVGASLGSMVKQTDFGTLNMKELNAALEDVMNDKDPKIDMGLANEIITKYLTKRQEAVSVKSAEEAAKFFEENKQKEGVVALESGLQYKILAEGNGITPAPEDTIEVHYKGTLIDGTQFDSSYDRNETATLALNNFIPGWVEGMQKVSEGGKIELYIPAELAYGNQQMGTIKPGSTLIFEVELIKIKKAAQQQ